MFVGFLCLVIFILIQKCIKQSDENLYVNNVAREYYIEKNQLKKENIELNRRIDYLDFKIKELEKL